MCQQAISNNWTLMAKDSQHPATLMKSSWKFASRLKWIGDVLIISCAVTQCHLHPLSHGPSLCVGLHRDNMHLSYHRRRPPSPPSTLPPVVCHHFHPIITSPPPPPAAAGSLPCLLSKWDHRRSVGTQVGQNPHLMCSVTCHLCVHFTVCQHPECYVHALDVKRCPKAKRGVVARWQKPKQKCVALFLFVSFLQDLKGLQTSSY